MMMDRNWRAELREKAREINPNFNSIAIEKIRDARIALKSNEGDLCYVLSRLGVMHFEIDTSLGEVSAEFDSDDIHCIVWLDYEQAGASKYAAVLKIGAGTLSRRIVLTVDQSNNAVLERADVDWDKATVEIALVLEELETLVNGIALSCNDW